MHLNGSQCWFLGSKTSSIQYKTKDCNMYLFLNVSFHSLTKIESNSSQIRFFFFTSQPPKHIDQEKWHSLMQTYKNPMSHYSPHKIVCTVWSCCRVNHEHKKTSSKSWLIENVTLNCLFFFFFPTFPFGQNFCAVNYSVQLFVCSHCEQHVWQLALFVLIVDWGVLITSPSID